MAVMSELEMPINQLREMEKMHAQVAKEMMDAYEGTLYPLDLLALAAIHRSLNLLHGFCELIQQRNLLCAALLLRLQLDNCLRFYAAFIVKNPHGFASEVLSGVQVNKQKDSKGAKMTDAYLVQCLAKKSHGLKSYTNKHQDIFIFQISTFLILYVRSLTRIGL